MFLQDYVLRNGLTVWLSNRAIALKPIGIWLDAFALEFQQLESGQNAGNLQATATLPC